MSLAGYSFHYISIGNGKGLVTYFKSTVIQYEQEVKETNMQIVNFTSPQLDTINVYRSRSGHSGELLNRLLQMLTKEKIYGQCKKSKRSKSASGDTQKKKNCKKDINAVVPEYMR